MHLALAGAVVAALAIAPRAEPAFPGANGEIAFSIVLPTSYEGAWLGDAQHFEFVLCTIQPAGGARQRITALDGNTLDAPAWSADGSRLVLTGAFPPSPFVERVDGSGSPIYLPSGRSPAWAPAGDRIAYGSRDGLAVVNLVGGQPQTLASRGDQPAWSPDGTRIAYIVDDQLAIIGADGSGNVVLTSGPAIHASPNWSPDGQRLVFVSRTSPDPQLRIELMNADGSERVHVTWVSKTGFGPLDAVDPSWSPDGSMIAFVKWDDDSRSTDVYTIKPDGSGLTNLTHSPFDESSIDWRPLPASSFLRPTQTSCGVGGTSGADTLRGTSSDDVVDALGGSDRILTGSGFDIVLAGAGDDRVRMGPGEDDLALGENGKDVLDGEDGRDGLFGGDGNDRLLGGRGSDELQGQGGKDVLVGGPGVDRLVGGPGDDRITPGLGRDEDVFGDAGNDTILLRDGERDVVHCGKGRDEVQADRIDRVFRDCERVLRR